MASPRTAAADATAEAANDAIKLLEPNGKKLGQMIARYAGKLGGQGGRAGFNDFAQKMAQKAAADGTYVTGTVGHLPNATIYRDGIVYLVVDEGGVMRSFTYADQPGGIIKVYTELGGK
jgi:hypothetical protein